MQWFALQVMSAKEEQFRRLALAHPERPQELHIYFPRRAMRVRRQGRETVDEQALFPGYLFVSLEELTPQLVRFFQGVPGFVRWLGTGRTIRALDARDLEILGHFLRFGERLGISQAAFNDQMRIEVLAGPLKGLEGRIVRVDKRKGRARVRLDLYDSSFEVDFGFELISGLGKDASDND